MYVITIKAYPILLILLDNFVTLSMRLFRFLKFQSLETKQYLKYGIGEVFLVVIGILLALQVNNWNEKRKLIIEEKKTLLSFHNEVSNNLNILERSIFEKQKIIEANNEILKYIGPNEKWLSEKSLDSLMYHITVSGWIFVPEDGVLNEIINSGKLSIIQDEKIKNEIASLPQLLSLILEEDRLYRDDLHQYFLPFLSKNYKLRNITSHRELLEHSKSDLGISKFENNPVALLNNPEFENILTIQSIWIKFSIDMCINQKSKYEEIQRLIENKYPNVDYSSLKENLDRGFWG